MRPEWFAMDAIPYSDMWSSDPLWLPLVFDGKQAKVAIHFAEDNIVETHEVTVVESL